jgi:hypothetical protein
MVKCMDAFHKRAAPRQNSVPTQLIFIRVKSVSLAALWRLAERPHTDLRLGADHQGRVIDQHSYIPYSPSTIHSFLRVASMPLDLILKTPK